ncbi:MAG: transcription termination/antitermination protein NusA [Chloroflexi bacterium]|nr:transcription termination/antitermination protein NusA [Chloroflexota bacterium]
MKTGLRLAITHLAAEKNLPPDVVLDALKAALVSALKKEYPNLSDVDINPDTDEIRGHFQYAVVASVHDPRTEIGLEEARRIDADAQLDETVTVQRTVNNAGRIAAQTAKQVVMQRLREAEREIVYEEFQDKEGDILSGVVQRVEPKQIMVDLGKTEAVLPISEQVKAEHYRPGQRMKFYVAEVFRTNKGPQVLVSRTHRNLLRRLFEMEVPEIYNGTVEIKAIAREPGYRSKVAVAARQEGVDPVGSCVGLRGIRIQNIINELNGEKVDVIQWHPDPSQFVANALSPAQVLSVDINEVDKTATVIVPDRQLSLAIGKEGQNARLAAKLTGWRIDIKSASAIEADRLERARAALSGPITPEPLSASESEPSLAPAAAVPTLEDVDRLLPPVVPPAPEEFGVVMPAAEAPAPPALETPAAVAPEEAVETVRTVEATERTAEAAEAARSRVRFAEEIIDTRSKRPAARTSKREEEEAEKAQVKKKKSRPRHYVEEDDEVEAYEDILRRLK